MSKTQHAVEFVGVKEVRINKEKPIPEVGPTQILIEVEACGICFSDVKLINAFDKHPRKSDIIGGLTPAELAEIPVYRPGSDPVVPGHEPVGRIKAIGDEVKHHKVGERVLIQTDYRHLPTKASNAAFGYNLDGALQEYALVDERVVMDPETGDRFLIPVAEDPSASAIALIEPWACVEAAYAWHERQTLLADGKLLVVLASGRNPEGVDTLTSASAPASITTISESDMKSVEDETFDDIIYFGSDATLIKELENHLGMGGILDIVLAGEKIADKVPVDVGRVHYDLIRYTGTSGSNAAEGYTRIPATPALRGGDKVAIIGAAGPMGLMHTMLTVVSMTRDITVDAIDVDDARLARLEEVVAPAAIRHEVPTHFINSKNEPVKDGYNYVAVMVPAPPLVQQAVDIAAPGAIINAFAGFPIGTTVELDVNKLVAERVYMVGTSGSRIQDMIVMQDRVAEGLIDTNVSLWAVSGLAGAPEAIEMVENRTSGGKIMVYPHLHDLGVVKLSDMAEKYPDVAAEMTDGVWTLGAERMLMSQAQ